MELITRKQALQQGLTTYFTGRPCSRGHISKRQTKSGNCTSCRDYHNAIFNKANPNYHKDYGETWRKENPHKYIEYYDKWHQNVQKYLFFQLRSRAIAKNIPFDLALEDLIIPKTCPIFGIPLFVSKGRNSANSPSVDRIDNTKGYVKGNVHVISWKANKLKNDATMEDLQTIVNYFNILHNRCL